MPRLPRKYGNIRAELDGYTFDSLAEQARYVDLKALQRAGEITYLEADKRKLRYPLIVGRQKVGVYVADFRYLDLKTKKTVVEDVKGVRTAVYRLKKKLVNALYGIDIREIDA